MKSPNKVKDQICNMGNGLSCVHPRHRIVCATTSPSHAGCSGDSFSHLCDSSPAVSRFSAHTCCHTHIGSEMHIGIGAHTIWNGGWRRGAGVDNWKTHGGEYQHTIGSGTARTTTRGSCVRGGNMCPHEVAATRTSDVKHVAV